ncbi:MAG: outer membrane lipoprotein-sorting protein [Verrucomicrobiota bacterium]
MKKTILISLCLLLTANLWAETGRQIMDEQKKRHESSSEEEVIKMVLIDDKSGQKENRDMIRMSKKGSDGTFKYLARFESPANVRGVTLLTWEKKGGEDDQWLYMPAQGEKLKRIAGNNRRQYFMGTDFAYEDLGGEKLDDYNFNVAREEDFKGAKCWMIDTTPANDETKKSSGYSKREIWVCKDDYTTRKTDYYDKGGKLLKTAEPFDIVAAKGDMKRASSVLMTHHQNKHKTLMGTKGRKINEGLDDSKFTERAVLEASK